MIRRPPRSTRTDTLFPYTKLCRSLALDRAGKRDATPALPVAHPMLEHEGRRGGVADRPAMRAAVGQAVHRVVGVLQRLEEIEIAVGIVRSEESRVGKGCVSTGRSRL